MLFRGYIGQMRLVVIIVAALMVLGVTASALILAQQGGIQSAAATSTVYAASEAQEASAPPTRAPVSQTAQVAGSEVSAPILQANVDTPSGAMTAVTQVPLAAATASNVKDQSRSTSSKAIVHETARLKDDATGWAHKLQQLELDLKLQLDLKKDQDLEAAGKDINECLVVLRAAAGRLAPDAQTKVTLHKEEVAIHDLAIRAEVHSDPEIRKTADYFQQKTTELRTLNRSAEEIRTRLVTQIDRLENLKTQLKFNHTAGQIGEVVKDGMVSLDNILAITEETQRIVADLNLHRRSGVALPPQ